MRVDPGQVERDDAAAERGIHRAVEGDVGDVAGERLEGVGDEVDLVLANGVHPERGEVVDRDTKPDRVADGRRPRLELPRDVVEVAPPEVDLADHLAAGQERRHRLEQLAPRPQRARSPSAPASCGR